MSGKRKNAEVLLSNEEKCQNVVKLLSMRKKMKITAALAEVGLSRSVYDR
jgi:ACT domain-containing protein